MSDSEDSTSVPPDSAIENALRNVVISIHGSGKPEDLTVKRVRAKAEEELGLDPGFFKCEEWKQKSHKIIHAAVEQYCAEESSPPKKKKTVAKTESTKPRTASKKAKPVKDPTRGAKRPSPLSKPKPQKRRKIAESSNKELDASEQDEIPRKPSASDSESKPQRSLQRASKRVIEEDSDEEPNNAKPRAIVQDAQKSDKSEDEEESALVKSPQKPESKVTMTGEGHMSESELSSLIDEPPAKKKRQKKAPSEKRAKERNTSKAPKAKTSRTKNTKELDPDEAEVKRLQGWLVKCGIKKVWSKELASCDRPKAKINHLKDMLKDAGMDGRYSIEKANRIKAQRELAAELEAVQEGARRWGQSDSEQEESKPRRRLARGARTTHVVQRDDDSDEDEVNDSA